MTKYVSRLVAIEARQFNGGIADATAVMEWINSNGGVSVWCGALAARESLDGRTKHTGLPESLRVKTPDGWSMLYLGDYVIRHPKGYFYRYDQVDFEELYIEEA